MKTRLARPLHSSVAASGVRFVGAHSAEVTALLPPRALKARLIRGAAHQYGRFMGERGPPDSPGRAGPLTSRRVRDALGSIDLEHLPVLGRVLRLRDPELRSSRTTPSATLV